MKALNIVLVIITFAATMAGLFFTVQAAAGSSPVWLATMSFCLALLATQVQLFIAKKK